TCSPRRPPARSPPRTRSPRRATAARRSSPSGGRRTWSRAAPRTARPLHDGPAAGSARRLTPRPPAARTMTTTDIALAAPTRPRGRALSRRDLRLGEMLLAPALAYIFLLVALPFLLALFLSLTNSSAGSLQFSFVGLQNFRAVMG